MFTFGMFLFGFFLGMIFAVFLIAYLTPEKILEARERMETWQRITDKTIALRKQFKTTVLCDQCAGTTFEITDP